jgi:hypothetical protein
MYYFHGIGGVTRRHAMTQFSLLCCLALFLCVSVYGFTRHPLPIYDKGNGIYRDRNGRSFTKQQFHAFQIWEGCFAGSFGLVVIAGIANAVAKRGHKHQ